MSGWSKVGSAALGTGGGILGGVADAIFGGIKAKRNWKYKKKEMALQNEYALGQMAQQHEYQMEAWNAENAYNDPSAVRARYEAAGISPQAALGGAASGAGIAGSMATPGTPSGPSGSNVDQSSSIGKMDILGAIQSQRLTDAEVSLKEAQARQANESADTQESVRELNRVTASLRVEMESLTKQQKLTEEQRTRFEEINAELAELSKEPNAQMAWTRLYTASSQLRQLLFAEEHQGEKFGAEMKNLAASTLELGVRAAVHQKQIEVMELSKREVAQRTRLLIEQTNLTSKQYETAKAELKARLPHMDEEMRNKVLVLAMQAYRDQQAGDRDKNAVYQEWTKIGLDVWNTALDTTVAVVSGGLSTFGKK